jgi:hypothetical protein
VKTVLCQECGESPCIIGYNEGDSPKLYRKCLKCGSIKVIDFYPLEIDWEDYHMKEGDAGNA